VFGLGSTAQTRSFEGTALVAEPLRQIHSQCGPELATVGLYTAPARTRNGSGWLGDDRARRQTQRGRQGPQLTPGRSAGGWSAHGLRCLRVAHAQDLRCSPDWRGRSGCVPGRAGRLAHRTGDSPNLEPSARGRPWLHNGAGRRCRGRPLSALHDNRLRPGFRIHPQGVASREGSVRLSPGARACLAARVRCWRPVRQPLFTLSFFYKI